MDSCFRLLLLLACLILVSGPAFSSDTSSAARSPESLRSGEAVTTPAREPVEGESEFGLAIESSTVLSLAGFSPPITLPTRDAITEIVDLNGDDIPDLVGVNRFNQSGSLFYGRGDGTFEPQENLVLPTSPSFGQVGDLDRDGIIDLVFATWSSEPDIVVLWGEGGGGFSPAQLVPTSRRLQHAVALVDLTGDDLLDVVVTNRQSTVDVLLNAGNRQFESVQSFPPGNGRPGSIAVRDMDRDGNLDLVLGTVLGDVEVAIVPGLGDGTFGIPRTETAGNIPVNAVPADVDGDGDLDVLASGALASLTLPRGLALIRQDANGGYLPVERLGTANDPYGLAVTDLNADGIPDIVVAGNFYGNLAGTEILWGSGTGTFVPVGVVGPGFGEVLVADFNRDGRPDFLTTAGLLANTPTIVQLNETTFPGVCMDQDGDGYGAPGDPACPGGAAPDCDDQDPDLSPGGVEACDGVDNDCDGRVDEDFDRDEDGVTTCAGDCDDEDAAIGPAIPEICDGRDNNCDGLVDEEPVASASCVDAYACTADACSAGTCVNDAGACLGVVESSDRFAHPVVLDPVDSGLRESVLTEVTGDGLPDIVNGRDGLALFPGRGIDGFGPAMALSDKQRINGLAPADIDGDGDMDLAVSLPTRKVIGFLLNDGSGRFAPGDDIPVQVSPGRVEAPDLDGDGLPDLAVEWPGAWALQFYGNEGDGHVVRETSLPTSGKVPLDLVDYTGDELPDPLLVGFDSELFINEGDFEFGPAIPVPTGGPVFSQSSGDLNEDGTRDIAFTDADGVLALLGNGGGSFESRRSALVLSFSDDATLLDLNRDETPDLLTTSGAYGLLRLTGNGDGTFQEPVPVGGGGGHLEAFGQDLDADGCDDVAFTGRAGTGVLGGTGRGDLVFHPRVFLDDLVVDVAIADVDGSGANDVVVLFSEQVQVLLAEGQGDFRRLPPAPVEQGARSLIMKRIDTDDWPDLVILHGEPGIEQVTVSLGLGDGTFAPASAEVATGRPLFTFAVGDVTADGLSDIVVANDEDDPNNGSITTFPGGGDGTFLPGVESDSLVPVDTLVLGEFSGDDVVDAAAMRVEANRGRILVGSNDGFFTVTSGEFFDVGSGFSSSREHRLEGGDLNADGRLDLVHVSRQGVHVVLGTATGGLQPQIAYPSVDVDLQGASIDTADVNGDDRLDVLALNDGGSLVVYAGQGNGMLAPPAGFLAGRPEAVMASDDLNGDGLLDVVVGEAVAPPSLVFLINGAGGPAESRLPDRARGRECPPGLRDRGGPPGRGIPPDVIRLPCRFDPPPCARARPEPRNTLPTVPFRQAVPERRLDEDVPAATRSPVSRR